MLLPQSDSFLEFFSFTSSHLCYFHPYLVPFGRWQWQQWRHQGVITVTAPLPGGNGGCAHTFTLLFFIIIFMTTLGVIVFILLPKTIWSQTHWSWSFQWLLSKPSYVLMTKCAQVTFLEWLQCILEKEETLSKVLVFWQIWSSKYVFGKFQIPVPFSA